jgi:hypothetical protein
MYGQSYGMGARLGDAPAPPKVADALTHAAISGLVGAAEGYLVYGNGSQLLVPGLGSVSAPVGFGVHTLLSSLVAQYADPYLQTATTASGSTTTTYSPIIPYQQVPVLSGVAQVGTHMLAGNSGVSAVNAFLIGSTSEWLGAMILSKEQAT